MKRRDLLVHPVRSRIIGAVSGRSLTTAQIARALPDVPVPTLYRQMRILAEAGIIVATEERRIRGATEKSYTLVEGGGALGPDAMTTAEERLSALTNFTSVLGHAYRTYVDAGGELPPQANLVALYLSEDEERALHEGLRSLIVAHLANPNDGSRRRRIIAVVNQPDYEPEPEKQ